MTFPLKYEPHNGLHNTLLAYEDFLKLYLTINMEFLLRRFHDRGMGGPPSTRGNFNTPPRGLNGGGPFDNQRNNGWGGGPINGGSGNSIMNQGPMMGGGGMNMGGSSQGNGLSPNKTTTQVTIPKDVSLPLLIKFNKIILFF